MSVPRLPLAARRPTLAARRPTLARRPAAARRAIALYDTAPRGDRFHVRARWWSAPLAAVEEAVPPAGRILEIGCGHGLLSLYLALCRPDRRVIGVDIDRHKIDLARRAADRLGPGPAPVSFLPVEPGELPAGPFAAVVVCDVLYLLRPAARAALVDAAVDRLAPGGRLLIKETAPTPRWKGAVAKIQERLATGVLRITAGDGVDLADPATFADQLRRRGLRVDVRRLDRGYPHAHVLVTGHAAPAPEPGPADPTGPAEPTGSVVSAKPAGPVPAPAERAERADGHDPSPAP